MSYKVLILEESPSVKKAIRNALSHPEFELYPFDARQELLERIRQFNPDILLLSLSLALGENYQALGDWRRQDASRKTVLIFLRKVFEPVEREKIAELDYDEMLNVPFDSQRLVSLVRGLIEKKEDPPSLPEEPFLDDFSPQEEMGALEERVKALVKQETFAMGRELEKRIRAWVLRRFHEMKKERESKA